MYAEVLSQPSSDTSSATAEPMGPQALALGQIFDELDTLAWPVRLLERRLPELLICASALAPQNRCAWLGALHQLWHRHGWALDCKAKRALLELAAAWCAWPLARSVGQSLLTTAGLESADALHLIQSARQLGDGPTATSLAIGLQLAQPTEQRYAELHTQLQAWLQWRDHMPVLPHAERDGDSLRLEPLAHHHYQDFIWQYHDATIAKLCCLPVFQHEAHWHCWLDHIYAAGDERIFAVLHRDWGFIGCVSLILHDRVGLFYYWMGSDFQGRGHGPRAVRLLLSMAQQDHGLRCCYAKVLESNRPSRRALEKLDFQDLGISAIAPEHHHCFYRWGASQRRNHIVSELHWLLACISSETRPAALLLASMDQLP